jgi:hypothetical protein
MLSFVPNCVRRDIVVVLIAKLSCIYQSFALLYKHKNIGNRLVHFNQILSVNFAECFVENPVLLL